jgi:hypothetical protein
MNHKGLEMAISTLIIIILAIALLVGLIIAVKGGFSSFKKSTDPFYQSTQAGAIKQACELACTGEDTLTYCCTKFNLDTSKILCTDPKLGVSCKLSCAAVSCLDS